MKTLIGYIRVSTKDQGVSGNGLEAQHAAILKFAADNGYELVEIVKEVASGKLGLQDRPVLKAAITKALKMKATLVVSKLDRLSRDAAFIMNLMNTRVQFVIAQFGEQADPFMIHMYAVLGEKERKMIGQRTKDALTALQAKGVKLGGPNTGDVYRLGNSANASKADTFAERMRPAIQRMLDAGMSMRAIAAEFNENGTTTARGGNWDAKTVSNIIARWA